MWRYAVSANRASKSYHFFQRYCYSSAALTLPRAQVMTFETYDKDNTKVVERFFSLPLDYSQPEGAKIRVFARNLIPKDKAKTPEEEAKLPYFVYLQGGPGFEVGIQCGSGLASSIHERGYQTLWLDQRGTGLSSPISAEFLTSLPTDAERVKYLKNFRADSIVKDCEAIRQVLLGDKDQAEDRKWTILGQSFGGFCAITYLSFFSEGLKEVFLTGGLAPLVDSPDPVYTALIAKVSKRNSIYYAKYPQDIRRVHEILKYLENNEVVLPNGGQLTVSRWQQLGLDFGMKGGIDRVHQLVFRAWNDLELFQRLDYKTLQLIQAQQPLGGNPLYAIMHEPIYCQGRAPKWSASRIVGKHAQFSWPHVKTLSDSEPIFFTGEMIFPDMFDDYVNLRPLKSVAEILAHDDSWSPLYDLKQLAKNKVKVTAATYYDDMFVDFALAQDTASKINNIEQYITNHLLHNAIRMESKDVMAHLFRISKREYD